MHQRQLFCLGQRRGDASMRASAPDLGYGRGARIGTIVEGQVSGQQLVGHDARRPHVCRGPHAALQHLRRHVPAARTANGPKHGPRSVRHCIPSQCPKPIPVLVYRSHLMSCMKRHPHAVQDEDVHATADKAAASAGVCTPDEDEELLKVCLHVELLSVFHRRVHAKPVEQEA